MVGTNIMVLIAILRYRAVVYPFHAALSRRKLTLVTISVYLLGVGFVISHVVLLVHYSSRGCFEVWPDSDFTETYLSIISIIHYFVPTIIMSGIYFKISRNIIQQYKDWQSTGSPQQSLQAGRHQRNFKSFFPNVAVVFCFALTGLPMQFQWILYRTSTNRAEVNGTVLKWLYSFYLAGSSAVNPYIYGTTDKKMASVVKSVFKNFKK